VATDLRSLLVRLQQLEADVTDLKRRKRSPARTAGGQAVPRTGRLVKCTTDGGDAGTRTTPCTFTYTIKDYDTNETIDTTVSMEGRGPRILNIRYTAGSLGLAFRNSDGAWKLLWVNESGAQSNC
jgi:hypothetical protein